MLNFLLTKKKFIIFLFIIFCIALNYPQEKKSRSIDSILADIRKEQGLKETDKINPDKVSPKLFDELGDAVIGKMIVNHDWNEFIDQMMGGKGSESLKEMHQRIGYDYLTENLNWFSGMMGYPSMMNWYPFYNNNYKGSVPMNWNNDYSLIERIGYNCFPGNLNWIGNGMGYHGMMNWYPFYDNKYKGGFPMMWNNICGLMGWGFGGWIMGFIFLIILIAVCMIIFLRVRNSMLQRCGFYLKEAPLDVLKKRYAKGEISKEDFERMKKDIC